MNTLLGYFPGAVRRLAGNPSLTLTSILALGIGIGLTTGIFTFAHSILIRPLPFPDSEKLVMVYESTTAQPNPRGMLDPADFMDLQQRNRSFISMAAYALTRANLLPTPGFAEESDQITVAHVTADFFSTLGIISIAGRTFFADEDRPGKVPAAVMSERLWSRRYAGNPNIIGHMIDVSGKQHVVVGVVPSSFSYPNKEVEMWTIRTLVPPESRTTIYLRVIARLKPGVIMAQALGEVRAIAPEIERENPAFYSHLMFSVAGLKEAMTGQIRNTLILLQIVGVIVLLIAIINVANLLLTQGVVREKEIAVRTSLGAMRGRIIAQLMVENVVLSLLSGAAGLIFAYWVTWFVRRLQLTTLPRADEIGIHLPALLIALLISLAAPLVFGLYPSLQCSRPDLMDVMRQRSASGGQDSRKLLLKRVLVAVQVATTFVLTVGACLMFRSLVRLQRVDLGFTAPADQVLAVQIDPTHLPRERQYQFYQELLQRLQSLKGVKSAALSLNIPPNRARYLDNFTIPGLTDPTPNVPFSLCGANVFKTLGIPLLQGRDFNEDDQQGGRPAVIISESLAKQYFGNTNPIGRSFKQGDSSEPENPYMEIVGVVGDVKFTGVRDANTMSYYGPYTQEAVPYWKYLLVRANNPLSLVPTIRAVVRQIDSKVSIGHPETMEQVIAQDLEESRIQTFILLLFAVLAILLAAIGIYGLMLYTVVQEGKEIALRIAVGAQRWHVVYLVSRRAFILTCTGILVGVPVALLATRLLRTFLFDITASDPQTFALMGAVVMSIAMAATIIPVWKAVRTDPGSVLKSE